MSYATHGSRFAGAPSFSPGAPMTDDDLRRIAPSIFAVDAHESRSARYTYVPTFEVLAGLRRAGFVPVRAIQGKSRVEGKAEYTKHMVRLQHPDYGNRTSLQGVAPEVVLLNSHDGTSSYRMLAGVFRMICTNSMIVMEDGATDIRVAHKGDILGKVIEGSFEVIGESRLTLDKVETWQGMQLSRDEQMVLAEAAHMIRFAEADGTLDTPIKPQQLLGARRSDDQGADLWRTHNRLQENMIRGGLHARTRQPNGRVRNATTREVKGIDGDIKLNRAMWLLSQRMAELKQAA